MDRKTNKQKPDSIKWKIFHLEERKYVEKITHNMKNK